MSYPEHEKLATVKDLSQEIGEFLEWCEGQMWQLAEWDEDGYGDQKMYPIGVKRIDILARYFKIDLDKLEAEKVQMLEAQRVSNEEVDKEKELEVVRAATEKLTEKYRDSLEDLAGQ